MDAWNYGTYFGIHIWFISVAIMLKPFGLWIWFPDLDTDFSHEGDGNDPRTLPEEW